MTATLRLERSMPGLTVEIQGRHVSWSVLLDGQRVGSIAPEEVFETPVTPGPHTLRLSCAGRRRSPARTFSAPDESVVEFCCHSQPVWPLMVMALALPGRWIVLKPR